MLGGIIFLIILVGAFFAFFALIFYTAYKKSVELNNIKEEGEQKYGSLMNANLKHIDGLPLPQNVPIDMFYCPDKIVFKKDNQEITISKSKITSIDCVSGANIKGQLATGAMAGKYILGGTTGAVIGSLVSTTVYLIIAYTSNQENKYITLDLAYSGGFGFKVEKDFKKNNTSVASSIEL